MNEEVIILRKILFNIDIFQKETEKHINEIYVNDYLYKKLKDSLFHTVRNNKDYINGNLELIYDSEVPLSDLKIGSNGIKYKSFQIIRI